jgi:multidrug efflux pump subunit AcrA (membrane-fusion protein)
LLALGPRRNGVRFEGASIFASDNIELPWNCCDPEYGERRRGRKPRSHLVQSVSADRILDETTRQYYYLARVEVDREIRRTDPDIQLMPGMPAKVLIVTGQQTLVQYLLKPFTDVLRVFI